MKRTSLPLCPSHPPHSIEGKKLSLVDPIDRVIASATRLQMVLPLQILVESHRPLAFVLGQCLALLAPLSALFPTVDLQSWSTLLSQPDAAFRLSQRLQTVSSYSHHQTSGQPAQNRGDDDLFQCGVVEA